MSVDKDGEVHTLYCDVCFYEVEDKFYSFKSVAEYKKANGWTSTKEKNIWFDICPICKKEGNINEF